MTSEISETSDDIDIRRAGPADATAAAEVWLRSFGAALPTVRRAHDDEAVRGWFTHVVVPEYETWVAVAGEAGVVGLLVLDGGELEQLYLDPSWQGRGLGDRFVELAKRQRPEGLGLWTFQVNGPARRFYERHGFVEAERTDGRRNEEREPDVRYVWRPAAA
ncbi:GNAT family N-acetyltransferase [Streptomyces sp. NPDC001809]